MMPTQDWVFRSRAERVIDGDTIEITIDQGLHSERYEQVRILGVNCPEIHGPSKVAGDAAAAFTRSWLGTNAPGTWPLRIQTVKDDAFGRWLATVWRVSDGACLNDDLLSSGNAVVYKR